MSERNTGFPFAYFKANQNDQLKEKVQELRELIIEMRVRGCDGDTYGCACIFHHGELSEKITKALYG